MYFPCFLCKFSRGEPVDKAGGGVMCTTSKGTCSYFHTSAYFPTSAENKADARTGNQL